MKKKIYFLMLIVIALIIHQHGYCQTESTLWSENFEGNWTQNWYVDNGTWEVGVPTSGPNAAHGGTKCAATILAGNYLENANTRLIRFTSFVVPSDADNPRLRYYGWFSFGSGDYGQLQIKPAGASNWTTLGSSVYNYSSNVWSCPYIDLKSFAGQTVQIAFYFYSDSYNYNVGPGWYIDDVSLVTGPVVFNNPETFESGIGEWGAERGTWEVGDPTGNAHGGQNCAATNLNGNYSESVNSLFYSPPFTLPGITESPRLRFWHSYSFSSGDYGIVLIKPTDSKQWVGLSEQIINNSGGVWTYTYYDLSVFAGLEVQFAFLFISDQYYYNVSTGWYIDDVLVEYTPYSDQLALNSGWNLLSFDIALNQATPATVFQPLITTNNLQMVTGFQNQQGVFFDPDGPGFMNTLNNLADGEGYWAKLLNAATLPVTGIPLSKNFTVDLLAGWNLIGNWPHETTTPALAFASLIAAGKLEMVTSYENAGRFFDPDGPPYLNTLTEIKNGFGYWVKLNAGFADFSYPAATWLCGDKLTDNRDGKSYETVKIGTQCWMKENLNVGSLVAGTANQTNNGTIEKYCYNDLESNCDVHGGLYQWDEMMEYSTTPGIQGICPDGWHLPDKDEVVDLANYLGGVSVAGGKLKTIGDIWIWPNTGASNSSGFSALPSGFRHTDALFYNMNYSFTSWISLEYDVSNAWIWYVVNENSSMTIVESSSGKARGRTVRCIKNN